MKTLIYLFAEFWFIFLGLVVLRQTDSVNHGSAMALAVYCIVLPIIN